MTRPAENFGRRRKARADLDSLAKAQRKVMSIAERKLWNAIRGNRFEGFKFRRQHPIGRFIADFACIELQLVVEIDGESHDATVSEDLERTRLIESLGYQVIRFANEDVLFRFEGVLKDLYEVCVSRGRTPLTPALSPEYGGEGVNQGFPS